MAIRVPRGLHGAGAARGAGSRTRGHAGV